MVRACGGGMVMGAWWWGHGDGGMMVGVGGCRY